MPYPTDNPLDGRGAAPAQHTPGPWRVLAGKYGTTFDIRGSGNVSLAAVYADTSLLAPHGATNARLIAASPRMLAALRTAESALAAIRGDQFKALQARALGDVRDAIFAATEGR